MDEKTLVEFDKTGIVISAGDETKLTGTIKSYTCEWKVPFKEGKTIIKAILVDQSGDVKNVTITIRAKDGKVTFLAEVEEMPDKKIRLVIDKFEEKS